jgi:hypothetical protein
VNFKVYSIFYFFLKKKIKNKLSKFNKQGYQIESIKYFNNKWLIPTAECILFKIGKPCGCRCHHPNSGIIHSTPCCEDGLIFD